jgi:ribosomal protein S7
MNKEEQLNYVSELLAQVMYHGLESEVVLDALELVKENPDMDPILALQLAAADWDVYIEQHD